jgi:hypothetical protein
MAAPEFILGKPRDTLFHRAAEAMINAAIANIRLLQMEGFSKRDLAHTAQSVLHLEKEATAPDMCVVLVEHDWSSAIPHTEGEVRLPSPNCVFEFRVNGKHAVWWKSNRTLTVSIQTDGAGEWHSASYCEGVPADDGMPSAPLVHVLDSSNGFEQTPVAQAMRRVRGNEGIAKAGRLAEFLTEQVRAMCVALDAEVLEKDTVRAPHKLNAKRIKQGRLPLLSYHRVKLARRERAAPLASEPGASGRHMRMHFVRGHWRHFEESKTWVRWHLRGDPDLGRIEKEYRL